MRRRLLWLIAIALAAASPSAQAPAGDLPSLLRDAESLRSRGSADALRDAAGRFERAIALARGARDTRSEATALAGLGRVNDALGDRRTAIERFERALALWRELGDRVNEAYTLNYGALAHEALGARDTALEWLTRARPLADASANLHLQGITLNNFGVLYWATGDRVRAIEFYEQALAKYEVQNNQRAIGMTLYNLGTAYDALGEKTRALDYHRRSLPIRESIGDPRDLAYTLHGIGFVYQGLDDPSPALDYYGRALEAWRRAGDRGGEAATLNNIGAVHEMSGAYQSALDYYKQALTLERAIAFRYGEGNTLLRFAGVYNLFGERDKAIEIYEQSLPIQRAIRNRAAEGANLSSLAAAYGARGDADKAFEIFDQALEVRRAVADPGGEASTLMDLAGLHASRGGIEQARTAYEQARVKYVAVGSRRGEALTRTHLGRLEARQGRDREALAHYGAALEAFTAIGDRPSEAYARYCRALSERALDRLDLARADITDALAIVESLRATIVGADLRSSYFATVQQYYELAADVFMRLDGAEPGRGHAAAFETSERARARALVDLLAESRIDIREGVDAKLLARERDARARLNALAAHRTRALTEKASDAERARIARELAAATDAFRDVEAELRGASPRYAALTQPHAATDAELRRELQDGTLLLEYALGESRSWVWAVSADGVRGFELPPRSELEPLARRVYDRLSRPPASGGDGDLRRLSAAVLGPVASLLGNRRLAIVADGALQYVPFGVLADPALANTYRPLLVSHEVVRLPSLSALAVQRAELAGRARARGVLAVVADPVFDAGDPRLANLPEKPRTGSTAERSTDGPVDGVGGWPRLVGSRREASAILALVPAAARKSALDFDASRATATGGDLGRFRIVHFATHAVLDTRRPELSGIVLSLVDRSGKPQDGFLRLHDLFNLQLPSDLVVLSACRTALGRDVRGEGLIGLTRGFMYAGAARIIASAWKVDDRATTELMTRMYQRMLGPSRLRPAAALRAAQLALFTDPAWRAPYYWAAFELQGEWR